MWAQDMWSEKEVCVFRHRGLERREGNESSGVGAREGVISWVLKVWGRGRKGVLRSQARVEDGGSLDPQRSGK